VVLKNFLIGVDLCEGVEFELEILDNVLDLAEGWESDVGMEGESLAQDFRELLRTDCVGEFGKFCNLLDPWVVGEDEKLFSKSPHCCSKRIYLGEHARAQCVHKLRKVGCYHCSILIQVGLSLQRSRFKLKRQQWVEVRLLQLQNVSLSYQPTTARRVEGSLSRIADAESGGGAARTKAEKG
jgi:hypothetical protein